MTVEEKAYNYASKLVKNRLTASEVAAHYGRGYIEGQEDMNKKIWHEGVEYPQMYVDPKTGAKQNTFALCILWYDGWKEDFCQVTEDGRFKSMTGTEIYDSNFFEFWAYTYDLIPSDLQLKRLEQCPSQVS